MNNMISFHGKQEIKEKYLARLRAHYKADEIVKGVYWEKEKGCAVGCTIHSNDHFLYETELGIPRILAKLQDGIFENLPNKLAKEWPIEFLDSIPIGVDLKMVWPKFVVWLLTDQRHGVMRHSRTERTKKSIIRVSGLYKEWIETGVKPDFYAAAAAADAAAAAADADDAAAYAAYAAAAYAADAAATAASADAGDAADAAADPAYDADAYPDNATYAAADATSA